MNVWVNRGDRRARPTTGRRMHEIEIELASLVARQRSIIAELRDIAVRERALLEELHELEALTDG